MNNKELLELAAKAAGINDIIWNEADNGEYRGGWTLRHGKGTYGWWNPLTDDGDALRLACDLGLCVYPIAETASGVACSAVGTGSRGRLSEVADFLDTRSATRLAIVRAAAEIVKNDD